MSGAGSFTPRSPRTGREPLDSSGSRHSIALRHDTDLPVCKQTVPLQLLRIVPPLCLASVLSASRVLRLCLSLCIETTGSKVPCLSLIRARAALRPGVMPVVNRISPTLLPGPWCCPGFDTV